MEGIKDITQVPDSMMDYHLPDLQFSNNMDPISFLRQFRLDRKIISEKSGIKYRRLTNLISQGGYSPSEEESQKIERAILDHIKDMLDQFTLPR